MHETLTNLSPNTEIRPATEVEPRVTSFKTSKGSVYTYDEEGKTTRFKTATGEMDERDDITVFLPLSAEQDQKILEALHFKSVDVETKIHVVERQPDDSVKILRDISEVTDPNRVYLGLFKNRKMVGAPQVSLSPVVGCSPL
jgi:hypothetical protein